MVGVNTLRNLWTMIAHIHGNVLNYSNLSRAMEVSSTTLKKYFDFLEHAFLIRQLKPYHSNVKKRIVKSPKIYIRDPGMLHYLLGIENNLDLEGNPMKGNSWEGYAIEQIIQFAGSNYDAFVYRTHQGAECDLVLTKSSKPVYSVEIKYISTPKPTKGNLISIEDIGAKENFKITPDAEEYMLHSNLKVCSLDCFLKKHLPTVD